MKLSSVIAASTIAFASATKLSLRYAAPEKVTATQTDAQIVVHGLNSDLTKGDAKALGVSLVLAYNDAYAGTGLSLESKFDMQSASTVPEVSTNAIPAMYGCTFCPPSDPISGTMSTLIVASVSQAGDGPDDSSAHSAFETAFCDKLQQSGRANFANANGCSVSFLKSAGQATGARNDIQVSLKGMLQKMSPEDAAIFDKSVEDAFNEAFKKAEYTISGVRAVSNVDVTDVAGYSRSSQENVGCQYCCNFCPPDDDTMETTTLILARVDQEHLGCQYCCNFCPPDDDNLESSRSTSSNTTPRLKDYEMRAMESAFENALCHKLQNSGSANFANVHSCSFRFVSNPVQDAKKAAQQE